MVIGSRAAGQMGPAFETESLPVLGRKHWLARLYMKQAHDKGH